MSAVLPGGVDFSDFCRTNSLLEDKFQPAQKSLSDFIELDTDQSDPSERLWAVGSDGGSKLVTSIIKLQPVSSE